MTDDALMELLQRHLTGDLDIADSIAKLAESDPRAGRVAELLAQREQQLEQDLEQAELDAQRREEAESEESRRFEDRRRRAEALRRRLDEMTAETETLRSIVDDVAGALGACPSCFGENSACRWCRGRGRPGFMRPDPDGFERLVMPAVRLHARLRGPGRGESENQPDRDRDRERTAS